MKTKNACMLILTAFIWGTAFVAQSVGMDYLGPFTFNGVRNLIGGVALLPCIAFLGRGNRGNVPGSRKDLIVGGSAAAFFSLPPAVCSRSGLCIPLPGNPGLSLLFIL